MKLLVELGVLEHAAQGMGQPLAVFGAAAVTLLGTRLCWCAPRNRMSIEERAKDGKLSEDEARRKIQRIGWSGPAVTVLGFALLAYALMR